MCDNNITLLIRKAAADSSPGVVLLLNKNRECVGAIYKHYLKADLEDIVVCTPTEVTPLTEKYFLVINGVGIFFTYFQVVKIKRAA